MCYLNSHLKDMHGVKNQIFEGNLLSDKIKIFRCKKNIKIFGMLDINIACSKFLNDIYELTLHCRMMYSSYLRYRFSLH